MALSVRPYTLAERPDLTTPSQEVMAAGWPAFVLADPVGARHWPRVLAEFPAYQVVLVDQADGSVIGTGHSLPFAWDRTASGLPGGWDDVVEQAIDDHDHGRVPTAAAGLSVTLAERHRGKGLSRLLLLALRAAAADHGLHALVIPVRPTLKSGYPLIPMRRYRRWTTPAGAPFDPWLRVHWRLGARFGAVAAASMRISGTVAEWEAWTGMRFPGSGRHVVPGALVPVEVDRERDLGRYVEPNVWMHHLLPPPRQR